MRCDAIREIDHSALIDENILQVKKNERCTTKPINIKFDIWLRNQSCRITVFYLMSSRDLP